MNKSIILASASPRRRELLAQIGLTYQVVVSDVEEKTKSHKPWEMVEELSGLKAGAVFDRLLEEKSGGPWRTDYGKAEG